MVKLGKSHNSITSCHISSSRVCNSHYATLLLLSLYAMLLSLLLCAMLLYFVLCYALSPTNPIAIYYSSMQSHISPSPLIHQKQQKRALPHPVSNFPPPPSDLSLTPKGRKKLPLTPLLPGLSWIIDWGVPRSHLKALLTCSPVLISYS
jgi:hypothetical protein